MRRTTEDRRLVAFDGALLGVVSERLETDGTEVVLVQRAEHLGGGTIILPAPEMEDRDGEIVAPYENLSIREAPPSSPNVPLSAYLRYWERLEERDTNQSEA